MNYEAINFARKVKLFDEQWQPKVIAEMNNYQFKIAKLQVNLFGTITRIRMRHSTPPPPPPPPPPSLMPSTRSNYCSLSPEGCSILAMRAATARQKMMFGFEETANAAFSGVSGHALKVRS